MLRLAILALCVVAATAGTTCSGALAEAGQGQCHYSTACPGLACGGGVHCQCVDLIWRYCNVACGTDNWRQGSRVIDSCSSIPKYTAVATFSNGIYDWMNDRGHGGIMLSCTSSSITILDQWCGQVEKTTTYPYNGYSGDPNFTFRTSSQNYYVIE